ncbi:hypothetical protein MMC27_002838 [Xylographa pallens]|nr:hypothetical protein [Xylographa pallens]
MVADPISTGIGVAAGALAFAEVALASAKVLYNQFESIKSHKDIVNRFVNELATIQTTLQSIVSIVAPDFPRPFTQQEETRGRLLEEPLRCCTETCDALANSLKCCKINDSDGKMDYFRKWLKQNFKEEKTKEAWRELERHKNILAITLQIVLIKDVQMNHDELVQWKNRIAETAENIINEELPRVVDVISHLIREDANERAQQMQDYQHELEAELRLLKQASEAAANVQPSSRTIEANEVGERSGQYLDAGPTGIYRNVLVKNNKSTRESMQYIGDMSQYKPEMMDHMARPGVVHTAPPAGFSVTPGPPANAIIVAMNRLDIYPTAASRVNKPPVPRIEASRVSEDDAFLQDSRTLSTARAGQPAEEAAISITSRSQEPTEATQGAEIGES